LRSPSLSFSVSCPPNPLGIQICGIFFPVSPKDSFFIISLNTRSPPLALKFPPPFVYKYRLIVQEGGLHPVPFFSFLRDQNFQRGIVQPLPSSPKPIPSPFFSLDISRRAFSAVRVMACIPFQSKRLFSSNSFDDENRSSDFFSLFFCLRLTSLFPFFLVIRPTTGRTTAYFFLSSVFGGRARSILSFCCDV